MPSGRAHAAMSSAAALGLYWVGRHAGFSGEVALALAGGCAAGIVLSPDLDMGRSVFSHRVVRGRFGALAASLWGLIWFPYGSLIRHRSWLSHMPLVGTAIRAAYVTCFGLLLAWVLGLSGSSGLSPDTLFPVIPWAFCGLVASDTLHWASDVLWSRLRRGARHVF